MMDEGANGAGGTDGAPTAAGLDPQSPMDDATGGWTVIPESSPPPASPVRPARWRWWIAVVATVLVVGSAAGVALVATRGAGASPTLGFVPANAVVYAEGRLDVPGDQGVALASFLSNFPGFTDTSNVQSKLSQAWDRLFRAIPGNPFTYSGDVAPWVQGTVAVAVLPGASPSSPVAVAFVAVADQARAQSELDRIIATARSAGASPTQTTISGATVWTLSPPRGPSGSGSPAGDHGVSVALLPGVLVAASDPAVIGSVQDVKDGRAAGLEGSQAYRDATSGAASSDLASIYVSTSAVQQEMRSLVPADAPIASPLAPLAACAAQKVPAGVYGTLRAQADRLVADLRAQEPSGGTLASAHASTLVDHVPGTALAYIETHDAGKALACILGQLKASASASSTGASDQVGQIEGLLGGQLESFVSWLGDAGIVVNAPTNTQSTPSVALVATVTDPTLAAQRLGQLRSLVALATMAGTQGLTISESTHGSVAITTLTVTSASLPSLPNALPGASSAVPSVAISWALADGGDPKLGGRFILAPGPDAVVALLDQQPAQSLGSTPAFTDALASAGGPSTTGFSYFDLRAIRAAAESVMPASEKPVYESDVRPYLLPFDRLVTVNGVSGSTVTSRAIITVGTPQ